MTTSAVNRLPGWAFLGTVHHEDPVPVHVPWCFVRDRRGDQFYAGSAAVGLYIPDGYGDLFELAAALGSRRGQRGDLAAQVERVNTLDRPTVERIRTVRAVGGWPPAYHLWRTL